MRCPARRVLLLLALGLLTACGGSAPTRHYYALSYPYPQVERPPDAGYKYPYVVRVTSFDISLAYEMSKLVTRTT